MRIIKRLSARFNAKKYDEIVILGYNCEVAFRFFKYYRALNSGLFNWIYSYSIDDLIFALNNFDLLATGEMKYPNPLWECANTNIRFHGREPMDTWNSHNKVDDEVVQKDLDELKSRVCYLKEKFKNIALSDSSKLYIYKMKKEDIKTVELAAEKINSLYSALLNFKTINFKLLIILEEENYDEKLNLLLDNDNIFIRSVEYFAPDIEATDRKHKIFGWQLIFDEFRPKKLENKKKHQFKFEEHNVK